MATAEGTHDFAPWNPDTTTTTAVAYDRADYDEAFETYVQQAAAQNGHHTEEEAAEQTATDHTRYTPGGTFVLDVPKTIPAIWGHDNDVLWAEGEALMIAGPQGVGKTTLALQLIRGRLGLTKTVLGYPVTPSERRILWLAMDRPSQAQRAAARLFTPDERGLLDERLVVWKGPPAGDLALHTGLLAHMAATAGADTLIVDSLKDAAVGLAKDEVGAGYNRTRQQAIVEGVQILELHHQVKHSAGGGLPNTINDVFGSVWLTSGTGSVLLLWGEPGDPVVTLRHLKQPMDEIGPLQLLHDHDAGTTDVLHGDSLVDLIRAGRADGLTAQEAAAQTFEKTKPSPAETQKLRRRLDKLVDLGVAVRHDGHRGGNEKQPSRYYLTAKDPEVEKRG